MMQDAIIMPEDDERELKAIVRELDEVAASADVIISGGHTEIICTLSEPVITMTVIGISGCDSLNIENIRPGMDIVMCGQTAILGTVLIYHRYRDELLGRYSKDYLRTAERLSEYIALGKQTDIAIRDGAEYMHDISTGGVFAALWELADGADCGIRIDHDAIPILQETIEICEFIGVNPYMADGSGAFLIVCEDGTTLCDDLYEAGYEAAVIGKVTAGHDRVVIHDDEERFLNPPKGEYY